MIVNYPVGGPTDLEGCIVALHLPNHIPRNPNVVVKMFGGAGGIVGSNQLGEARPDGNTTDSSAMKTKYSDFVPVFGVESPLVVYMRGDTSPGVKVSEDLMKTQEFKALSLNLQNSGVSSRLRLRLGG